MSPEVAVSFARPWVRLSIAVLAAVALAAAPAAAQTTGTIRGAVTDAGGASLPGVVVTAIGPGVDAETVTDGDGAYEFTGVTPGDHIVTATLFGYAPRELQVTVRAGAVEVVPIVLQLAFQLDPISVVAEEPAVFARNFVAEPMMRQQASITAVTSVIDNLPGVSVQEGDAYAFDDWSSNVVMRGFQSTINDAQIGTTIDGFPNGTSDYWSGAKANRFVDPINLGGVEVSQGTADIASRSVEALGGTLNFLTADPAEEASRTASVTIGENDGQRFAARVETGSLFGGTTRAWAAAIRQEATDWMEGSARNEREHLAAKVVSSLGAVDLTAYFAYDDIVENNYQRLYSEADFRTNPRWDRLIGRWPGVPYLNQSYRRGWGTLRTNTFAYARADWSVSELISLTAGAYHHRNRGQGDWLPPYIVDVVDDRGGPESELAGLAPVRGGSQLGVIRFVDGNGAAVGPVAGCTSSFIFNYYGSGGRRSTRRATRGQPRFSRTATATTGRTGRARAWTGSGPRCLAPEAAVRCAPASGTRTLGAIWAGTGTAFWTRWSASGRMSSPTGTSTSGTFRRTSSGGSWRRRCTSGRSS